MDNVIQLWAGQRSLVMSAGELTYFHGAHMQHIVDYEDHLRAKRHDQQVRTILSRGHRRWTF